MKLVEDGLFFLTKPRVIHALPGRLRLHVSFLKRWGRDYDELVALTARLLTIPEGIHEVSPCAATGNVLIRYDAKRYSEDELLAFLDSVFRIVMAQRDDCLKAHKRDLTDVEARLRQWLRRSLSHRLHLDRRLRIPEDVFQ